MMRCWSRNIPDRPTFEGLYQALRPHVNQWAVRLSGLPGHLQGDGLTPEPQTGTTLLDRTEDRRQDRAGFRLQPERRGEGRRNPSDIPASVSLKPSELSFFLRWTCFFFVSLGFQPFDSWPFCLSNTVSVSSSSCSCPPTLEFRSKCSKVLVLFDFFMFQCIFTCSGCCCGRDRIRTCVSQRPKTSQRRNLKTAWAASAAEDRVSESLQLWLHSCGSSLTGNMSTSETKIQLRDRGQQQVRILNSAGCKTRLRWNIWEFSFYFDSPAVADPQISVVRDGETLWPLWPLWPLAGHFVTTLWPLWALWPICDYSEATLWPLCGDFVTTLWSFCGHFVTILWSFCGHFGTTLEVLCGHFVTTLWSFCNHFVITLWALWPLWSFFGHFVTTL